MAIRILQPFSCPTCADGTLVRLEVEDTTILSARRHPVMVTCRCEKGHALVAFVDANFQVRDVEAAAEAKSEKVDGVAKTKSWLDTL